MAETDSNPKDGFNNDMLLEIVAPDASTTPAEGGFLVDVDMDSVNPYQECTSAHAGWEAARTRTVKRKRDVEEVVNRMLAAGNSLEDFDRLMANSIRKKTLREGPSVPASGGIALVRNVVTGDLTIIADFANLSQIEEAEKKMASLTAQRIETVVKDYVSVQLATRIANGDIKHIDSDLLEGPNQQLIWDTLKTKARDHAAYKEGRSRLDSRDGWIRLKAINFTMDTVYDEELFNSVISELREIEVIMPTADMFKAIQHKLLAEGQKGFFGAWDSEQQDVLLRDMRRVEMKTLTQFTNRLRDIGYALQDDKVRMAIMTRRGGQKISKAAASIPMGGQEERGTANKSQSNYKDAPPADVKRCWVCGRWSIGKAVIHDSVNCDFVGMHPDANTEDCEWERSKKGRAWWRQVSFV